MDHQTFAQLPGNYGEFLGSLGVVATLFYLAIQVRQTRLVTAAVAYVSMTPAERATSVSSQ